MKQKERSGGVVALRFVVMMVVCALLGGVMGYAAVSGSTGELLQRADTWLLRNATWLMIGAWVFFAAALYCWVRGKQLAARLRPEEEDDAAFAAVDLMYSWGLNFSQIFILCTFVFMALRTAGARYLQDKAAISLLGAVGLLFAATAAGSILQGLLVSAAKKLYPEKRGNVWDTRFQKDWYASCDEAERQMMGQAALTTFKTMNMMFMVGFVVCVILGFAMPIGSVPAVMLGVFWLVHTECYQLNAMRLEHRKPKEK